MSIKNVALFRQYNYEKRMVSRIKEILPICERLM